MSNFRLPSNNFFGQLPEPDKNIFEPVTQLPGGGARIGTVINGNFAGPVFYIPEYLGHRLENVGIFGTARSGKTAIAMSIAHQSMQNGNICWIFDTEDEYLPLVDAVCQRYKPVIIAPEDMMVNFFEPIADRTKALPRLETVGSLLRNHTYIRDDGENLLNVFLRRLLNNKLASGKTNRYPSLKEVLLYLQNIRKERAKSGYHPSLDVLINRLGILCQRFEKTAGVKSSNMLDLLAERSVIFRLGNIRRMPLQFLMDFLLTWLAEYKQQKADVNKVHTIILDRWYPFHPDRSGNNRARDTFERFLASAAKHGIRVVLCNQVVSNLSNRILNQLGCNIVARLGDPKDIHLIAESMGLSRAQAMSIPQLKNRQVIVSYSGHRSPFKVQLDEFSFPPRPDEDALAENTRSFLGTVNCSRKSCMENKPVEPRVAPNYILKVLTRIGQEVETIYERCKALAMDRASEAHARQILLAKGYIDEANQKLGGKRRFYQVTFKGAEWAKTQGIEIKRFKSEPAGEYILNRLKDNISSCNRQYKFKQTSGIDCECGVEPDLLLTVPRYRKVAINIISSNVDSQVQLLTNDKNIPGIDKIIVVVPDGNTKKTVQDTLDKYRSRENGKADLTPVVILDAGECLLPDFDWGKYLE